MEAAYEPKTPQEVIIYFSDPNNRLTYLIAKRWPNGVTCPTCGSTEVAFLTKQRHRDHTESAWFLDHRIRFVLGLGSRNKLSGQVEADETFIGGKARNMHKTKRARVLSRTGGKDKTAVMGILERGGKVRTKVVDNTKKKTLQSEIREHVLAHSALFTDSVKSYEGLDEFQHEVVDHAVE